MVPNLGKGTQRICKFDEIAKPKYNVHHYVHDSKLDLTLRSLTTGTTPFENQTNKHGFAPKTTKVRPIHFK